MEDFNFQIPQRQSVTGILVMFADTLQKFLRAMWVPLALFLFKAKEPKAYLLIGGVVVLCCIVGAIIAYLRYRNFTFYLDEGNREFILKKGVFQKSIISINLDKIQQVNINQNVIQKISGVFSLEIDTAGSNGKEVKISAVKEDLAQALKAKLLSFDFENKTVSDEISEENPQEIVSQKPFIKLSNLTLLKIGLTSNYGRSIAILVGFFVTLYQSIKDFVQTFELDESEVDSVLERSFGLLSVGILIFAFFIVIIFVNIIRTFLKHFDFQMMQQNQSFAITSGLFAKKNTLVNPKKVQITSISRNFFQKKLKIFDINTKQASDQQVKENNKFGNFIEIPGCNSEEKQHILQIIFGQIPYKGKKLRPNFRYLIGKVLKLIIIPVSIFSIYALKVYPGWQEFFPLIFVYLILVGALIYYGFQNNALFVNDQFVIKTHGAWDVEDEIIEPYKIQAITTKQYFWNKKSNVGHVYLHTAAGDLQFKFGNFSEIKKLTNYWLYKVEVSKKNWM
ncbi:PH domain-containing protein [Flavobacterium sp. NST-5]|uniref:PH domain-containing protein n=1 Tax=Flavobacterium ichthyis TaxID=2698827 RepID=A0ABW9Z637_9FLAO|nr:PH domain-containing protein [Flavobacterium ichthyis]NBL64308.1 PH domain-containing protein [Flavobacterium ichthyis]